MKSQITPNPDGSFPVVSSGLIDLSLGNGTAFQVYTARTNQGLLVCVLSWGRYGGAYTFCCAPSGGYVADKLRLLEGDADRLACFIECQLNAL